MYVYVHAANDGGDRGILLASCFLQERIPDGLVEPIA